MKRLLVLVAVLVPLSFFVAGCGTGGSSGSKATTPSKEDQEKTKAHMQEMQKKMGGAARK